jgi:hypothetical protein
VVPGAGDDDFFGEPDIQGAADGRQAGGDRLEPPEASGRAGVISQPMLGRLSGLSVDGGDLCNRFFEQAPWAFLLFKIKKPCCRAKIPCNTAMVDGLAG